MNEINPEMGKPEGIETWTAPRTGGEKVDSSEKMESLNNEKIRLEKEIENIKSKLSLRENTTNNEEKNKEIRRKLDNSSINKLFDNINNAISHCRNEDELKNADKLISEINLEVSKLIESSAPAFMVAVVLDKAVAEPVAKALTINDQVFADNLRKLDTINCMNILTTLDKIKGSGNMIPREALFGRPNR